MPIRNVPIRVLITKPGLDGHDMGAKVVSMALKNAGMEVIHTDRHRTIGDIVATAIQEDVDVIGLSILSGSHLNYSSRLIEALNKQGVTDKLIIVGGCVPGHDIPAIDRGFVVTPLANNKQLLDQFCGRFRRTHPGKKDVIIYYFWDQHLYPGHKSKLAKIYKGHCQILVDGEFLDT